MFDSAAHSKRRGVSTIAVVTIVGLLGSIFLFLLDVRKNSYGSYQVPAGTTFIGGYDRIRGPLDLMVASGDGQAYAALARDPTLRHKAIFGTSGQLALRASRPVWGWLIFLASFGQARFTFPAMAVLELLSMTGLVWVLARKIGWWALLALVLPGVLSSLASLTPETLGMVLSILGMTSGWGWLVAAGLVRETYLGFSLAAIILQRRPAYLLPLLVWFGWQCCIRLWVGDWPTQANAHGVGLDLPFRGLMKSATGWQIGEWAAFSLLVVSAAIAARRFGIHVVLYAILGSLLGTLVWVHLRDFSRVLLPLPVLALIALFGSRTLPMRQSASDPSFEPLKTAPKIDT
jgi:hypothetical protein